MLLSAGVDEGSLGRGHHWVLMWGLPAGWAMRALLPESPS